MGNPKNSKAAARVSAITRILLVDNDRPWRRFVLSTVEKTKGLKVVGEAADGIEAIARGLALKPDLILLDVELSTLGGVEVARCLSDMLPGTKIIFLTRNRDKDVMAKCLSNGGTGCVVKEDARAELLPAIKAVMQGSKRLKRRLPRPR